ncbi:MAG: hypothetical protein V2A54_07745 [Bacteroidota bacterium]
MKRALLKTRSAFFLNILLFTGFTAILFSSSCRSRNTGKTGTKDTLNNPYRPSTPEDKYGGPPAEFREMDSTKN